MTSVLDEYKHAFIRRYNTSGTATEAYAKAVTAASQRNVLYREDLNSRDHQRVRSAWQALLSETTAKYVRSGVSDDEYERDVQALAERMNEHFRLSFRSTPHPRYRYAPGFRISHAQKSIAVALKHLWCLDQAAMPPQCPVDSIALRAAGLKCPYTRWTHVDSIDEHRVLVGHLRQAASGSGLELAEWELSVFPA